jgi:hypothetical protein
MVFLVSKRCSADTCLILREAPALRFVSICLWETRNTCLQVTTNTCLPELASTCPSWFLSCYSSFSFLSGFRFFLTLVIYTDNQWKKWLFSKLGFRKVLLNLSALFYGEAPFPREIYIILGNRLESFCYCYCARSIQQFLPEKGLFPTWVIALAGLFSGAALVSHLALTDTFLEKKGKWKEHYVCCQGRCIQASFIKITSFSTKNCFCVLESRYWERFRYGPFRMSNEQFRVCRPSRKHLLPSAEEQLSQSVPPMWNPLLIHIHLISPL